MPSITSNNGPYLIMPPATVDTDIPIDEQSPITLASASPMTGMGKWDINFHTNNDLSLKLDAAAKQFIQEQGRPVVFTTNITWNVITGP